MKIVVSGSSGQLGRDCTQILERKYDVVPLNSKQLDITNPGNVEEVLRSINPSVILNCAAYTKVDECETKKELAWKVNLEGARNLALASQKYGALLIHLSTDYVFDGTKKPPEPYGEDDTPNPRSYYGKSKFEGERAICTITNRHAIVRTAWLYGAYGHNFLKTMLRLAVNDPKKEIKVVNDQFGSPTWSFTLALQIEKLIEVNGQGIYHATSEGYCTWYEFASYFLQHMGVPHRVSPCTSEEYPTPASRPKNSILENQHLKKEGINLMRHWQDDLDHFLSTYREHLLKEAKPTVS